MAIIFLTIFAPKEGARVRLFFRSQEQQIGQLDWLHPQRLGFFRDGLGVSSPTFLEPIWRFHGDFVVI